MINKTERLCFKLNRIKNKRLVFTDDREVNTQKLNKSYVGFAIDIISTSKITLSNII